MTRPQHARPVKGCRGYALGGDDEQEGAQHHRKRGVKLLLGLVRGLGPLVVAKLPTDFRKFDLGFLNETCNLSGLSPSTT